MGMVTAIAFFWSNKPNPAMLLLCTIHCTTVGPTRHQGHRRTHGTHGGMRRDTKGTGGHRDTTRTGGHSGGTERDTKRTGGNNGGIGARASWMYIVL
jgi:hypothetical protein